MISPDISNRMITNQKPLTSRFAPLIRIQSHPTDGLISMYQENGSTPVVPGTWLMSEDAQSTTNLVDTHFRQMPGLPQ